MCARAPRPPTRPSRFRPWNESGTIAAYANPVDARLVSWPLALLALACSSGSTDPASADGVGGGSGGAVAGASSGGEAETGGSGTGGVSTGGLASMGGSTDGGASTGGASTGGSSTGGLAPTGGTADGGASMGGSAGGVDATDGGSSGAGAGGSTECGPDGLLCETGEICFAYTIYPNNIDPNDVQPPTSSYSCEPDPCAPDPLACDCARSLCSAPECVAINETLRCTYRAVCTSPDTLIATPEGERRIADLRPGELVYSADRESLRPVPILEVSRTPVFDHEVVEIETADGTRMEISPGHPTADGRRFGALSIGDRLDGVPIVSSRRIPYRHAYTYDILPDSDSGTYVAFGKLIGSTLRR